MMQLVYIAIGGFVPVGFLFLFSEWKVTKNLSLWQTVALSFIIGMPVALIMSFSIAISLI